MTTLSTAPIVSEIVEVSPEMAREMLDRMFSNRNVRPGRVRQYAQAMVRGEWMQNGQGIIFDTDDRLVDGQHRLMALMEAGVTLPLLVIHGISGDAVAAIDMGLKRTNGDVLQMLGYKDSNNLAATLRLLKLLLDGPSPNMLTQPILSPQEMELLLEQYPDIPATVPWAHQIAPAIPLLTTSHIAAVFQYAAIRLGDPDFVEQFFESLATGASLHARHPALVLRNQLVRQTVKEDKSGRFRLTRETLIAWTIIAIKKTYAGDHVQMIKVGNKFPTLP